MRSFPAKVLLAILASGCTLSGTIDNIPNQKPVQLTDVNFQSSTEVCPERRAPEGCAQSDVKCSYDTHGCEICVCSSSSVAPVAQ